MMYAQFDPPCKIRHHIYHQADDKATYHPLGAAARPRAAISYHGARFLEL